MSYNTVSSTVHILLCSIVTDKVLVEKQEEIEILQKKIKFPRKGKNINIIVYYNIHIMMIVQNLTIYCSR